jgi:phosphatidylglycerol:prolipoprotein diacylglycerol transferase
MGLPFALSALSATIYAVRVKIPLLRLMDILAPAASLGLGIASIGCLAAGCDYGLPTKSNWGLVFASRFAARTTGVPLGIPLYPTQIFDSLASLLICAILLALLARRHREGDGAATWLFLNGMTSFFLDFYRGTGDRGPFVIRVFAGTFTGTQLLAMLMVLLSGVIWSVAPKPQAEQPIHAR